MSFRYLVKGKIWTILRKKKQNNEEMKICGSPNPLGDLPIGLIFAFCYIVLSSKRKDPIRRENKQWVGHLVVL